MVLAAVDIAPLFQEILLNRLFVWINDPVLRHTRPLIHFKLQYQIVLLIRFRQDFND